MLVDAGMLFLSHIGSLSETGRLDSFTILVLVSATLGALVLVWRLLSFSIMPMLRPNVPKEIPYWVPGKPRIFFKLAISVC